VDWYDDSGYAAGYLSSSIVDTFAYDTDSDSVWYYRGFGSVPAASGAKYAKLRIVVSAGDAEYAVDEVRTELSTDGAMYQAGALAAATTTSATPVTFKTYTDFVQRVPGRRLSFHLMFSCYTTVAATTLGYRLRVTWADGTVTNTSSAIFYFNQASVHTQVSAHWIVSGDPRENNALQVEVQWFRVAGTGTLTQDANDYITLTQDN
jgi:hypothetical protein